MDVKLYTDIMELENLLKHLPEHQAPPMPSEGLSDSVNPPKLTGNNNFW